MLDKSAWRARLVAGLAGILLACTFSTTASAQGKGKPPPAPPAATEPAPAAGGDVDSKKAEATAHFERALRLFNDGTYDAALVEFRQTLALFPNRNALQNTAVTLKKLKRFDEAADAFDKLLVDYPNLPPEDRKFVEAEKKELVNLIAYLDIRVVEPDATVLVDGLERGKTPLAKPVRVSAGSRFVRVIKEGYVPFEQKVDIPGKATMVVNAKLGALLRGGRLRVTEDGGTAVDVLVDNVVVSKTPWEGTLPVGKHVVSLRGEGNLGSPPAAVEVQLNQLAKLSLVLEPLACNLRVEPTPITARVAVDGVEVGQGTWEGKLRCGGHQVEIGADEFLPVKRTVSISEAKPGKVVEILERDPGSRSFQAKNPPRITLDARIGLALSPNIAGSHSAPCDGACSSGLSLGMLAQMRIGYQLGMGLGFAFDAGFLYLRQRTENRRSTLEGVGISPQEGTADDTMFMRGPTIGGSVSVQRGSTIVVMGRLGAGAYIGAWKDTRAGKYHTAGGFEYTIPTQPGTVASSSGIAVAPYVNPEFRVGYRINKTWIVDLGLQAMLVFGMQTARWPDSDQSRYSIACDRTKGFDCPGQVSIRRESLFAPTIFAFIPFLGGRAEF